MSDYTKKTNQLNEKVIAARLASRGAALGGNPSRELEDAVRAAEAEPTGDLMDHILPPGWTLSDLRKIMTLTSPEGIPTTSGDARDPLFRVAWSSTPDPVTVYWLRALIRAAGLTQGEAARLLHVHPQTMRRWATGAREIPWAPVELLRRIVSGQDVDPADGSDNSPGGPAGTAGHPGRPPDAPRNG